jgi:hypothetical protein
MKKNSIVKNMTIEEASEFWDEHDFTEFDDVKQVEDITFSLKKKKYIAVDFALFTKIRNKAKKLNKSETSLIHEWLQEKV